MKSSYIYMLMSEAYDTYRDKIDTGIMFKSFDGSEPIMDEIKVRKWSDTEWHEPDVDYLGLEVVTNEN